MAKRRSASGRELGNEGEQAAAAHLERSGYRILERNLRIERVEIDLIAQRAGLVVFVEVKTRRSRALGVPEEAVDGRKRARIVRGAAAWLRGRRPRPRGVRFDVITCEPDAGGFHIRHLESAFDASD